MLLQNEVLALFAVIATGLSLGRVKIAGISLGSSVVSYAAAYPVALILMTVFAHALVSALG